MNNKIKLFLITAVLIIIGLLGYIVFKSKDISTEPIEISTANEITLAQVSGHSIANDCWTVIDQSVYNITPYIIKHPGGGVIENACGKVATDYFNNRIDINGQNKGKHSQKATDLLANYRIGIVVP